jgi:hypothetical protein
MKLLDLMVLIFIFFSDFEQINCYMCNRVWCVCVCLLSFQRLKNQTLWVMLCVVEFYKTNENAKKKPLFLMFNII